MLWGFCAINAAIYAPTTIVHLAKPQRTSIDDNWKCWVTTKKAASLAVGPTPVGPLFPRDTHVLHVAHDGTLG